ncbi:hypothetical protein BCR43DRAFT_489964 [Syncephalastrum racemosum]|uniref:Uncharacterized protein n=1 Tax=Syncephalastrum racemosum TaxID=13706 RepID=A0A1X2HF71_SYNRA|nr:hypothetical protein BCR43DRAFT_489964 [Syncephalastrum racemosum]
MRSDCPSGFCLFSSHHAPVPLTTPHAINCFYCFLSSFAAQYRRMNQCSWRGRSLKDRASHRNTNI